MILAPNNRLMLLDALRPPPGYELAGAIGTTFTLGLDALFIPPAAWALHAVGHRVRGVDPILLANTLRRFAERTIVFHQAGYAWPLSGNGELAAFIDEIVYPITVAPGATFHPKVWVLRFVAPSGERGMRVLIGSRNLSLDMSWDVLVRLDSNAPGTSGVAGAPLSDYLASLPERAAVPVKGGRLELMHSLLDELSGTSFALPPGCTRAEIVCWTGTGQFPDIFPAECDRRLVISPFLGGSALGHLPEAPRDRSVLVSRAGSLSADLAEHFDPFTLSTEESDIEAGEEGRIGRELHAKVYAFDHGESATLVLGSANATEAAFRRNDEVVVKLIGASADLGVERLLGDIQSGKLDTELALVHLLEPWSEQGAGADEGEADDRFYERAIGSVASVAIIGTCTAVGETRAELTLQMRSPITLDSEVGDIKVEFIGPGFERLPPEFLDGLPHVYELPLAQASRFVRAVFKDGAHERDDHTIMLVADVDLPPGRQVHVLRSLLTDEKRFLQFLRFLLEGSQAWAPPGSEGVVDQGRGTRSRSRPAFDDGEPVLEQLLRLLARAPDELRHLETVIKEFADDSSILPAKFRQVWSAIEPLIPEEVSGADLG